MNKKYLKLGVLLVGLLAFFGGTNLVSAGNNCSKDSYYVQNGTAQDGEKEYSGECRLYGSKGTMTITARNCDEGQAGTLAGLTIKYNGTTTYLEFTSLGFTSHDDDNSKGYTQYKNIVEDKTIGCPVRVSLNPDNWVPIFDKHESSFKFSNSAVNNDVNINEKHAAYSIKNSYYNKIYETLDVENPVIEENIGKIRDALSGSFTVSDSNEDFFDTLPSAKTMTLPKYTVKNSKYNPASFKKAAENPTQFTQIVNELKEDSIKISALAEDYNNASQYLGNLTASYSKISTACDVQVLEGLTRDSENYKRIFHGNDYQASIDNANNVIDSLVSGATENRKNKILNTVKACNKYAVDFYETEDTKGTSKYAKFIAKLDEVTAESVALEQAINDMIEVAKEVKLAVNLNDALNNVGSAKATLENASANAARALEGLSKEDFSFGENEKFDCRSLIGEEMMIYLNNAYFLLEVATVGLVIVLSMIDFTKAAASSDAEASKKAWKKLTTRIVLVVVLVILPMLVSFVINLFNIKGIDPDHPICITDGTSEVNPDGEEDI